MYRVEDKFICEEEDLFYLQKRMNAVLLTDANQNGKQEYTVSSVYFDDIWDNHLVSTMNGNRMREKYRIRIYNHLYDTIKLEVKIKCDNKVMKYSTTISELDMRLLMSGHQIEDINPSLDNPITLFNIAISKRNLKPINIVEYDRTAYTFTAGNVRITFDRNLRYSQDLIKFANKLSYQPVPINKPDSVLEVKYDEFLPGFIARILENGNMLQSSYSKYRLCRERRALWQ